MIDFTLCYSHEDGKMHVGKNCTEEKEAFVGEITDEIYEADWYRGEGRILWLENCDLVSSADMAMMVPNDTEIRFSGKNSIKVVTGREEANVSVLYCDGDLVLEGGPEDILDVRGETEEVALYSRAIMARFGNLTVNGGVIIALGGKAKKNAGLYAGGHIYHEVGEKGIITINAGHITATRIMPAAYHKDVTHIAGGSKVENALLYDGDGSYWQGPKLEPIDPKLPVVVSFEA